LVEVNILQKLREWVSRQIVQCFGLILTSF
jgi:hypothetical protein